MEYVYNEERDKIACKVHDPHFILAIFEDALTKEQRSLILHACTDLERHIRTVAEKYANENEKLKETKTISRSTYEKWLCGESDVEINGDLIPAKFVTDYLIAQDSPAPGKSIGSRYGDLSLKRKLLMERDANLMQALWGSWEKTGAKYDIVRTVEEPELQEILMDK